MLRSVSSPRVAGIVFVVSIGVASPVLAQESAAGDPSASPRPLGDAIVAVARADAAAAAAPVSAVAAKRPRRPSALAPLYVSYGALQVLDIQSTARALGRGGVEANPMMKGVAGNTAALIGVKAGGAAAVFFASEKMWRRSRTAAIVFMAAANSGMAWVVQHNYRAVR